MPTTSLYRNCNTTCAEFSKTIFADFLEMDHCFGSAGWIVHCVNLEDFVALLPYFRKCGNIARKTAFCPPTHFLNKIWRPNEQKFYEGSGLVTPSIQEAENWFLWIFFKNSGGFFSMKEVVFQIFNLNSLFRGVKTIFWAKVASEV